ncbi:diguanylate cyclase [Marinobacter sp. ATCH36]|uniref:diguanylate cyclase n=1 Tax=Marinobacter sp. ATCH36 TaxID=2945106 RepID=UPI00202007DD|nr:diguanylate cyclase [Marinobacter sp. ATCH36]MCL7942917.1 diguanylate cyclase [Marinobacter sp. ATCH36]
MRTLRTRLVVATLVPVFLVTATLAPIFWSNIQNRTEYSRVAAEALLEAEYDVLLQDMNESLNHSLAIAEFPSVVGYLSDAQTTRSPYQETQFQQTRKQLGDMLNTLLTHFGRYTRLALIDADGYERFSTQGSRSPAADPIHAEALYFREAMTLKTRSLYVTSPHLGPGAAGPETTTLVMDITTPVFGREGERLGVLLVTLDWHSMATSLPHAAGTNPHAQALLVDAQGNSLLPTESAAMPFGSSLSTQWSDAWQAMASSNRGEALFSGDLLLFRTYDIRKHHYRSQAEQVLGFPGTQPWRIGITVPRPGLTYLLTESPWTAVLVVLVYVLAIAFGIVWVLSNHHQQRLRARAQQLSLEAKDTARELTDLYQQAPCGYHSLNEHGVITRINNTELRWLGYSADEIIGKQLYRELVTPETREAFDAAFRQVLGEDHEGSAECELMCRDGSTFPVAIEATAYKTSDGFQYSRAMVFDMTERQKLEELLISQAMTDPLTGLGNRRYLENQADMEMARARRSGEPACLIGIDLDRFKNINDRYGHDVGDLVLQAFAQTAQAELREGDILCRMGGEEFTVLLPNTNIEQATLIAERLRKTIETTPVDVGTDVIDGGQLAYTASIGVTNIYMVENSLKPAIKRADQGLYKAKEGGRNRIVME